MIRSRTNSDHADQQPTESGFVRTSVQIPFETRRKRNCPRPRVLSEHVGGDQHHPKDPRTILMLRQSAADSPQNDS